MRGRGDCPVFNPPVPNRPVKNRAGIAVPALLLQLLILGCGSTGSDRVCGTEVADPDEVLAGCLVDVNGEPAVGIVVLATRTVEQAAKAGYSTVPSAGDVVPDSAETDRQGRYSFRKLDQGFYYITAQDTTNRSSLAPRIRQVGKSYFHLGLDTLFRTGRIKGKVLSAALETWGARATCDVPGQPYMVKTGVGGEFHLEVPPGKYAIICEADQHLPATVEGVEVMPGQETVVSVPMSTKEDAESVPPAPDRVSAVYDTALGIIHLSWPPVEFKEKFLYYVRRIDPKNSADYKMFSMTDTFFSDVIYPPLSDTSAAAREPKTVIYNILTCKFGTNIMSRSMARIEVPNVRPPLLAGPVLELKALGGAAEFFVGDTASLAGAYRNPRRLNKRLVWILEETGVVLKSRNLTDTAGVDTLAHVWTTAGKAGIRFTVVDEAGASASASLSFLIKPTP